VAWLVPRLLGLSQQLLDPLVDLIVGLKISDTSSENKRIMTWKFLSKVLYARNCRTARFTTE
jgi:hypothetical protein